MPAVSQAATIRRVTAGPDPSLPIAVFDSGVGGLTVLHECLVSLPEEDYLYLGDDARFPYGAKSDEELRACVERNTAYLLDRGAKLIVIACNSAASAGLETARASGGGTRGGGGRGDRARGGDRGGDHRHRARRCARDAGDGRRRRLPAGARHPAPRAHGDPGRRPRPRGDHPARLPILGAGRRDGALVLRAAQTRAGRHRDPRLHPLPARAPRCCSGSSAATCAW